ncbi:MAG: tetratricopeptide repeat protein, partial [Planctomycetes bacterium]|nr:tetratricopeptide repeat protein [Planctomycetota bacterium]
DCINYRAIALRNMNSDDAAAEAIDSALKLNPENSVSHSNKGWQAIQAKDYDRAVESFREALRLDPESSWARAGIIEALKAKHFIYALMLRYFLFMNKLTTKARWGIIIGAVVGVNAVNRLSHAYPVLETPATIILAAYIIFATMSFLASPFFNLMLCFNDFGRRVLSDDNKRTAKWLGAGLTFILAFASVNIYLGIFHSITSVIMIAPLLFPLSLLCNSRPGKFRKVMALYTIVMFAAYILFDYHLIAATLVIEYGYSSLPFPLSAESLSPLRSFYIWGCILSTWVGNFVDRE